MSGSSGIYTITSPSGGMYVGSAADFKKRWAMHLSHMRRGTHNNPALQAAFNKYTESGLVFSVYLYCEKQELIQQEQFVMDLLKPRYNMSPTAGSTLGLKYSEQARANLRAAQTPERRLAKSLCLTGIIRSTETCQKISAAKLGKKLGPMSEETKAKISQANTGKVHSEEWKKNSSLALKGKTKGRPKPQWFKELIAKQRCVAVVCKELNLVFDSHTKAGEWCKLHGRTKSDRAQSMISWAVSTGSKAYGLTWQNAQ